MKLTSQPNGILGILIEPTETEFLEIVNDFIRQHKKEYKNFCKNSMGVAT